MSDVPEEAKDFIRRMEGTTDVKTLEKIAEKIGNSDEAAKALREIQAASEKETDTVTETGIEGIDDPVDPLAEILADKPQPPDVAENPYIHPPNIEDSEFEKPAKTVAELDYQVEKAKLCGREYVEATKEVIAHLTKPQYPNTKYFHYHSVKVVEAGQVEFMNKTFKNDFMKGIYY